MKIGDLIEIYTVQEEDIIGLVTDLRNQKSSRMGVPGCRQAMVLYTYLDKEYHGWINEAHCFPVTKRNNCCI